MTQGQGVRHLTSHEFLERVHQIHGQPDAPVAGPAASMATVARSVRGNAGRSGTVSRQTPRQTPGGLARNGLYRPFRAKRGRWRYLACRETVAGPRWPSPALASRRSRWVAGNSRGRSA
jgi:hypothetical protein